MHTTWGKWIGALFATAGLALAIAAPALADTQATVNASVTAQVMSIQLTSGSYLNFGSQQMGAYTSPVDGSVVTVYNDGNTNVNLSLMGDNAYCQNYPASWSLSTMQGQDTFAWGLYPQWGGMMTYFTPGYSSYMTSLSPGQSVTCTPYLYMPTSTSYAGTYSWTGTIIANTGP